LLVTRIDWARALHWSEEVDLLLEEMRHSVTTYTHVLQTWTRRAHEVTELKPHLTKDIACGLQAYAYRQADTWSLLAIASVRLWVPFLHKNNLTIDWPESLYVHIKASLGLVDGLAADSKKAYVASLKQLQVDAQDDHPSSNYSVLSDNVTFRKEDGDDSDKEGLAAIRAEMSDEAEIFDTRTNWTQTTIANSIVYKQILCLYLIIYDQYPFNQLLLMDIT
jgi:hypothetical protein